MNTIRNFLIDASDIVGIFALVAGILIGAFHLILAGATLIALAKLVYDEGKLS